MQVGFTGLLGLAFIILKLCDVISWSWALVLLPLYGPLLFISSLMLFTAITLFVTTYKEKKEGL